MTSDTSCNVRLEIQPYPLKNKKVEKEWQAILSKLDKSYTRAKSSNLPNYFTFNTESEAIAFINDCWQIQLKDPNFTITTSIRFPTSYLGDDIDEKWIDIDSRSFFLLTTPYKDEFTAGLLAPFQRANVDSFLMGQDVWDMQMVEQFEKRNGKQWFNALDESEHQKHRGTYVGEILFYIQRKNGKNITNKNQDNTDEYLQIKDIADGDRYTFTTVIGIGLTTGIERILPMEELYIRRSPLMLKSIITCSFFYEAYSFLLDFIKDESFYPLNVYLWDEWELNKKIELLNLAYLLFIKGVILSKEVDSEEIDAAIAAMFIHIKQSVIAEVENGGNDEMSTHWRSFLLNVFNQVHSADRQSEIVQEALSIETESQSEELTERLAIWYFNEYPITIYAKNPEKWSNIIYYLATALCQVDLYEFEEAYEFEEVEEV